jgi:hypothetical protein
MAGIRRGYLGHGTGIHRGHVAVLAAPALGQTATPTVTSALMVQV